MEEKDNIDEREINKDAKEPFKVSKDGIDYLVQKYLNRKFTEELDYLRTLGGPKFFEEGLCTSFSQGLIETEEQREKRIEAFDSNERPPEEPIIFCDFVLTALQDQIIIILIIAAIVELVIGMVFGDHPELDWVEGVCIIIAVFVVVSVGSINDYNKEIAFRNLKKETESDRSVNVKKNNDWVSIKEDHLVTGDILQLNSGMTIPCDCLLIQGSAELDESAMTGEIDPIVKNTYENGLVKKEEVKAKNQKKGIQNITAHHEVESPIILSGTQVNSGDGCAVILAVGNNSENGKIRATINSNKSSDDGTPLEQKLSHLADMIGIGGLIAAIITSVGMALNLGIRVGTGQMEFDSGDAKVIINIFIIGIIVLVVAIPEGLPLAVTMTLSFSVAKMLKEKNLVRRMESCETMGNAEFVCTDKTGTLTKNEMLVTKFYNFSDDKDLSETTSDNYVGEYNKFFTDIEWELFSAHLACNTATTFNEKGEDSGNKSDESLTKLLRKFNVNVKQVRENLILNINNQKPQINFTSSRKKMSTIITSDKLPTGYRLFTKGASEIIMRACDKCVDGKGVVKDFSDDLKAKVEAKIKEYASQTLRTFTMAYRDLTKEELGLFEEEFVNDKGLKVRLIEEKGLTLSCIVGIKDHMKEGVEEAVAKCQKAGITVIMITGDNIDTAFAIAQSCGIAKNKNQTILGEDFMERIGGVICQNCNEDYVKEVKEIEENGLKTRPTKEINRDCSCPRSKDEWVIKWKQERKQKDLKEIPNHKNDLNDEKYAKEYEENLDKEGWEEFEKQEINVKVDIVADIATFKEISVGLRVIARSQPQHKYALVTGLRQLEHVVSVTGDGTNDAPALSKADVGFAMAAGTDIAKEASDIVILDNQFTTIVNAIRWGRNVFDNIRKFIQFQLTVNVCACILVMIGSSVGQKSPLTAIQMLWVNMIMDSLGSLALAAEQPTDRLLDRAPIKRTDFIINRKMMKHILGQSIYQLIVLFIILFSADRWLPEYKENWQEIAYQLKYCFPESNIHYDGEFKPENMYVLSGMETFFSNSTNTTFPSFSVCFDNEHFGEDGVSLKAAYNNIKTEEYGTPHFTILFNTFVLMQLANEFCCRVIDDSFNFFFNIHTNINFIFLWLLELGLQIIIICLTGPVFNVTKGGISPKHWGICIAFALITYPINFLLKFTPDPCVQQEGDYRSNPLGEKGIISRIKSSSKIRASHT